MKKLALVTGLLIPILSFASNVSSDGIIAVFQEQCAKEKDPVKRQNSCYMLDHYKGSHLNIPEFIKETTIATV